MYNQSTEYRARYLHRTTHGQDRSETCELCCNPFFVPLAQFRTEQFGIIYCYSIIYNTLPNTLSKKTDTTMHTAQINIVQVIYRNILKTKLFIC